VIFLTVGTQLPFDRMVSAVDAWAEQTGEEVIAQVGPTERVFAYLKQRPFLEPVEFDRYFAEARLVIAHAGMGSIIDALSHGKPLIIVPRRADLGEHRNDHQMSTARRFDKFAGVHVVWKEDDLANTIAQALATKPDINGVPLSATAPEDFVMRLKALIN
jgi:UDP-N-acetylglucosamine transferase subunit ALG13